MAKKIFSTISDSEGAWINKSILIVEDVASNYAFLAATLRKTGAKISWAKNGEVAIQMINDGEQFDLVLMDVQLSGVDGYEVTRTIKNKFPDLPIIAQTAYAMMGEKEKSKIAGCDEYLAKPIRPSLLLETLSKYLND